MDSSSSRRDEGPERSPHTPRTEGEDTSVPLKPQRARSWRRRVLWVVGTIAVLGLGMIGGSEYYTGRPGFCRSCHIMEPYYQSWSRDIHGTKFAVRCVDCHYAPGERLTFKAKFKGLSQATSYFSGRAGGARPRAHVSDTSCLTPACHGDGKYLDKKLRMGEPRTEQRLVAGQETEVQRTPTVTFEHQTHLNVRDKLEQTIKRVEELEAGLNAALPAELAAAVEQAGASVDAPMEREARVTRGLKASGLDQLQDDALEFIRLSDLKTRLTQLDGLTCAACHGYDGSGAHHFAVDRQTCYLCHFTNQGFNIGTGRCLGCHAPPTRQIVIHSVPTTQGAKPSIMDHRDILDRNIDCSSCHLDVVQGRARVSAHECGHCHDQASYLDTFDGRTSRDVEEYHRVHVAAQRARCPDCHAALPHQLIEPTLVATSAGFVKPVLDECQHCHPKHHQEQVELLMGVSREGIDQAMPNAMFGSRLNCRACHTNAGTDFKGMPLIEATAATCIACHEEEYGELLQEWLNEISAYLTESETALGLVKKRIEQRRSQGMPVPDRVNELVSRAERHIHLVRIGNGIHNRNYAMHLLDVSDQHLREALDLLTP